MITKARLVCEGVGEGGLSQTFKDVSADKAVALRGSAGPKNKPSFVCPECPAPLAVVKAHNHTFYDEQGYPLTLRIPSYFRRLANGQDHEPNCEIGQLLKEAAFEHGREIALRDFTIQRLIYKLNIETTMVPPAASPPQRGPNLSNPHRTARPARSDKQRRIFSKSVSKVETLKHLIDETCDAFGRFRQETILRFYGQTFFLSQIFNPHKKITDLFNKVVKHTREAPYDVPDPVLIEFKPITTPKFWDQKARTIQGQSLQKITVDQNGRTHKKYLSVVLRFRDDETYTAMTKQIRDKKINNFLIFAEKASVDLEDCRRKQASINQGFSKHNNTFFLYVDIVSPDQFCEGWKVRGQRDLGERGLFAKQDIPERAQPYTLAKPVRP